MLMEMDTKTCSFRAAKGERWLLTRTMAKVTSLLCWMRRGKSLRAMTKSAPSVALSRPTNARFLSPSPSTNQPIQRLRSFRRSTCPLKQPPLFLLSNGQTGLFLLPAHWRLEISMATATSIFLSVDASCLVAILNPLHLKSTKTITANSNSMRPTAHC